MRRATSGGGCGEAAAEESRGDGVDGLNRGWEGGSRKRGREVGVLVKVVGLTAAFVVTPLSRLAVDCSSLSLSVALILFFFFKLAALILFFHAYQDNAQTYVSLRR